MEASSSPATLGGDGPGSERLPTETFVCYLHSCESVTETVPVLPFTHLTLERAAPPHDGVACFLFAPMSRLLPGCVRAHFAVLASGRRLGDVSSVVSPAAVEFLSLRTRPTTPQPSSVGHSRPP